MIVDGISQEVTTTGIAESRGYEVKVGAKMFSLTMDKLYSNKLGSTIREVCSNAYDSHRSAGKGDVPFNIVLPTRDNEELTIEDFGTGLSNERVYKLFGTLFESSKDQSNGDVGGFGLGSKSPFSIADTYTVESNWEGEKTYFLNYKDSFGVPKISITGQEPTDAGNGIKIIIPIEHSERKEIEKEIRRQLYFFETKPTIDGVAPRDNWWTCAISDISTRKLSMNTTMYELPDQLFSASNLSHAVKIGPILYPLDTSRLSASVVALLSTFKDFAPNVDISKSYACSKVFVTEFPIGDLDISPSRESLSYIPDTLDKLNGYFSEFFEHEETLLVEHIEAQPTVIQRVLEFTKITSAQYLFDGVKKLTLGTDAFGNSADAKIYDVCNSYHSTKPQLVARREASTFRATVSARRVVDANTGTPTFINTDDIGQPCVDTESYVVWPKDSLRPLVFEHGNTHTNVSTMVTRELPMFSMHHLEDFGTRKHHLSKILLQSLFNIFYKVFEEPLIRPSLESLSPTFFFDDNPKRKKARIEKLTDEKDCFRHSNSYVITPADITDDAKQYTTMESIIEYIAQYCAVDVELVRSKFVKISDLEEPAVPAKPESTKIKVVKPKKAEGELCGVYWDTSSKGTATVQRDMTKGNLKLSMDHRDASVFLVVDILPDENFKAAYKRANYLGQLSKTLGIPVAYINNKTTEDHRKWLKENGGITPADFISDKIGVEVDTQVVDTIAMVLNEFMQKHCNIYEILDVAGTVVAIDDRYPLPALIEYMVELKEQQKERAKKANAIGGRYSSSTVQTFCRVFDIPFTPDEISEYMFEYIPEKFRTPGVARASADTKAKLRYLVSKLKKTVIHRDCLRKVVSKARVFNKKQEFKKPSFQLLTMLSLKNVKDVEDAKSVLKCIR